MKKIIWIAFAVLAALWTGLVALMLQLADWMLASIASAQVPGAAAIGSAQWQAPAWAPPWVDAGLIQSLQSGLVWLVEALNQILPTAGGLGTWIAVLGWLFWGFIMAVLLILALILHWLAGKRPQGGGAGRQVV